MKKILLFGENSCLAKQIINDIKKDNSFKIKSTNRNKLNIQSQLDKLIKLINEYKPNIIINCIALTGLLYCEDKPKDAFEINSFFPTILANTLKNKKIKLIHFSTEAVFKGKTKGIVYSESDSPSPNTIYGKSKLLADLNVKNFENSLIIRLPMLYGPYHKGQIIDKLMINLKNNKQIFVASDVYSTPLYSPLIGQYLIDEVLKKELYYKKKLVHLTSNKYLSIYEFVLLLAKKIGKEKLVKKVKDSYFGNNDLKPKYLGLKSNFKYCIKNVIIEEFVKNYE